MQNLDCSRCRARFHSGLIYESLERCPRCGARLSPGRTRLIRRLLDGLRSRGGRGELDWEAVTGSQYIPRQKRRRGDTPTTA
jgi:DNA-directed RNA polymerase subunit RPC12/RpoP